MWVEECEGVSGRVSVCVVWVEECEGVGGRVSVCGWRNVRV